MFESNITARVLIDGLKKEIDVSAPFGDAWYIGWINEVEQTLYGGLIEERGKTTLTSNGGSPIGSTGLFNGAPLKDKGFLPEDVLSVYADGNMELTRMERENAEIFSKSYCFGEGNPGSNALGTILEWRPKVKNVTVFYRKKPTLKTEDNIATETIKLPLEFLEMLKEKIRGEAFAAVGEYGESSNHLTAYNQYLDTFSQYLAMRHESFGR